MSERYIVGDKIDLSTLPNQTYVFPNGVKPVGLRIYGDTKTAVTNSGLTFDVNETTGGAVVSTDIDISSVALDGYKDISTSELDEYFGTGYAAPRLHPRTSSTLYAPIFAVLTEDTAVYISEHIAKITIDGEQAVRFSRQHPYYGIYGEGITASFDADFEDTDQGVYDTSATNTTIMSNYDQKDVIYIKGSGTIWVWAGNAPAEFPFKSQGKGGGSGGDGTHYKGTTTTPITDGATTNPITIDGESYTAVFGDIVTYQSGEFIFDGTNWCKFGDIEDTVGRRYYVGTTVKGEIFNTYSGGNANNASGNSAHAEGSGNTASGGYSHAEGSGNLASGLCAHVENASNTASGDYSHAEGNCNVASGDYSHVSGKYNDFQAGDLFEIGNGTNNSNRSNIVEVSSTYLNVNGDIKKNGTSLGDLAYKDSASGTVNVSVTGTTDGSVTISPTKETIYSTTNKGTLPSFTYNSTTEELTFNAGTLPSTTSKSVVTNATATFTGASTTSTGTVNVTVS